MRNIYLISLLFISQLFCLQIQKSDLDPESELSKYFLYSRIFLRNTTNVAYSSPLVGYTNSNVSVTSTPEDVDLRDCRSRNPLPQGVSLSENGILNYSGFPTRTVNSVPMEILCYSNSKGLTSSLVDFEIRGYDWVKSLSATGFNSPGYDVTIGSDDEIYFLASTYNNGSNLAADFGQNVFKNSSPTPGTSWSPLIVQLNSEGQLIRTRILGGVLSQYGLKLAVDSQKNVYVLSNLAGGVPLTINADSEFGGAAVNKTPSNAGDNFLLSQIQSNGAFGYAISVASTTTSRASSICYNPKLNAILTSGNAGGTSQDLGIDFGVSDSTVSNLGFQLEFTPEKTYLRSRKYLGTSANASIMNCKSDGSYTLGIRQSQLSLDYRIPFDGLSDLKTAASASGGAAFSSIDPSGNYIFTKLFSAPSVGSIPTGVARDSEGNYFFLFHSTGGNYDLRVGVDGISDVKTFAGSTTGSYLVKLNPDGSYAWGKMIRGSVNIFLDQMAIHPKRKSVFMAGYFMGTNIDFFADFGVSLPLSTIPAASNMPILVEINSDNGSLNSARMLAESTDGILFRSMKFDSQGNLYITGEVRATTNFQYGTSGGSIVKSHSYGASIPQAIFVKIRP